MTDKTIAKKEKALELLKEMDIYKPYIRGFRETTRYVSLKTSEAFGSIRNRR